MRALYLVLVALFVAMFVSVVSTENARADQPAVVAFTVDIGNLSPPVAIETATNGDYIATKYDSAILGIDQHSYLLKASGTIAGHQATLDSARDQSAAIGALPLENRRI